MGETVFRPELTWSGQAVL